VFELSRSSLYKINSFFLWFLRFVGIFMSKVTRTPNALPRFLRRDVFGDLSH
jgi:hypothetical protein